MKSLLLKGQKPCVVSNHVHWRDFHSHMIMTLFAHFIFQFILSSDKIFSPTIVWPLSMFEQSYGALNQDECSRIEHGLLARHQMIEIERKKKSQSDLDPLQYINLVAPLIGIQVGPCLCF